ncbi:hypothetical protein, partial [Planomonospora algeriensis]
PARRPRPAAPRGLPARDGLTETARRWSVHEEPTRAAHPAPVPLPAGRDEEEEAVTLLQVPEDGGSRTGASVRFGPGVPVETPAARIWREGRSGQATVLGADRGRASRPSPPSRSPARRYRTAVSAVILALMVAGAVVVWLLRGPSAPLVVTGVEVLAPKQTQKCGESVTIRGVLTTNGSPGEVHYRWKVSDKDEPIEQDHRMAAGETERVVSLRWQVKGKGSFKGTATLEVLSPVPDGAKISDKASITYRC